MSDLPKGWTLATLGEICSKPQYGWTSKASKQGKIKYLRTTDISNGKIDWLSVPFCELIPDSVDKYRIQKNDILVSRAGSVGISYRIEEVPYETVFASYLIRFNPLECALPQYVEYFLKSYDYWTAISEFSAGIAIPNVNATKLAEIKIPLPPLNEQKLIVEKLEKMLGKVEAVQARLDKIPTILKRFRQAVLVAACSGKLTADWREKDTIHESKEHRLDELINTRLELSKSSKDKEKLESKFVHTENEDYPESWLVLKAECVCDFITKGTTPNTDLITDTGEIPYLKVFHIIENKLDFYSVPCFVPKEIHDNFLKRSKVFPRDVIMNIVGPPLNKVAIIPDDFPEWNINQALAIFRPIEKLLPEFIKIILTNEGTIAHILRETRGIVGQSNISLEQCRSIDIPVPILSEQKEIVRRVEDLFKFADQIEARYKKARSYTDKLTQSILAKAFRGELVPQDETGEPASVLLERIKAGKEQKPKIGEKANMRKSKIRSDKDQQKLFASG